MQLLKLMDMTRGWFVGDFTPTALATQAVEVGLKFYRAGQREDRHYHKIAREITVIQQGRVQMNGREFSAGDIVVIEPLESTDFVALDDTVTLVVKVPGAVDDKYLGEFPC
jgi:quercetin dioxygenase-like cupin family protein